MADPTAFVAEYAVERMLRQAKAELFRGSRSGRGLSVEDLFAEYPTLADDPESAVELIYSDFVLQEEMGHLPDEARYLRRFPRWEDALRRQFEVHRLMDCDAPDQDVAEGARRQ